MVQGTAQAEAVEPDATVVASPKSNVNRILSLSASVTVPEKVTLTGAATPKLGTAVNIRTVGRLLMPYPPSRLEWARAKTPLPRKSSKM